MPFAYSITTGIAVGFIFFCITKICVKKAKEVHPIMYIVTAIFILNYLITALKLF
jgi:AGZA family xanthine/uracil permease-like MFS transporter